MINCVFMGTPQFSVHILQALHDSPIIRVSAVYCQPDRPAGRGKKLLPPPVKQFALEHDIPVLQPLNFKDVKTRDELASFAPDFLAVAAYGLILPQSVLDIPKYAPLNVHASLLPLYRGAAPIQRAILDCQEYTGVGIMHMEAGLDTGPVYAEAKTLIGEHTTASLTDALALSGAELLLKVLQDYKNGLRTCTPQDDAQATYAKKVLKHEGNISWDMDAKFVHASIRALTPWPGVSVTLQRPDKEDMVVRIVSGKIAESLENSDAKAGELWRLDNGCLAMATKDRFYVIEMVRPANKSEMNAENFANGYLRRGLGCLATARDA